LKRFVLNVSERTDGCFTTAFLQNKHAYSLCGVVAAQRLAVAMEHDRTYLFARTNGKTAARPPVFVCRSKQVQRHGSRLRDF
jgi:hypothetical protein